MRSGRPRRQSVEVDAPFVGAGLGQRDQARALERVLARALVAQPGLRQHELALDDLPDLHAGEPERAPDRTRDHAQHRAVLARLGEPREGLPEPAPAGRLARLGWLAAERVPQHRRGAPQRRGVRLAVGPGDQEGRRCRLAERLHEGRRLDARAPLDDPVVAPLRAQREPAVAGNPHRNRHREAAVQERAGDVAELGRRQVTRKRRGKRIIKALGRRAGRVHASQSSRLPSYTLALL